MNPAVARYTGAGGGLVLCTAGLFAVGLLGASLDLVVILPNPNFPNDLCFLSFFELRERFLSGRVELSLVAGRFPFDTTLSLSGAPFSE